MADNTSEVHLDNPPDTHPQNSAEEFIAAKDEETIKLKQEVKDMEVHKHPHHITHKKKFGEYLLEFLMLFLAVFLGFLAENFREHQADNVKEKEYMASMLSDLKRDTLALNRSIVSNILHIAGEDSALHFLAGDLNNRDTSEMALIYYYKYCAYINAFRIADGTISQLKNGGGLRLISNKDVTDKINSYYARVNILMEQLSGTRGFLEDNAKQAGGIFNYIANKEFIDSANLSKRSLLRTPVTELKQWLPKRSATMLTTEVKDLSPFMQNLSFQMGLMGTYVGSLKRQKQYAIELIQAIKENYHLENE